MHLVTYILARVLIAPLRLVPFWLLYLSSDGFAFLLYHLGYRKRVVMDNLNRCFPEKTTAERRAIAKASYRNLADITFETLKSLACPVSSVLARFDTPDAALINRYFEEGRSVLLVGGHYNNWEWAALTMGIGLKGHSIIVYKTLTNAYMDRWLRASRARGENNLLCPMNETFATVKSMQNERYMMILGADQSPSNRRTSHWIDFFGQKTACVPGPDVLGRQFDCPIVYFEIQRTARGRYVMRYHPLVEKPTETTSPEITQVFMARLEQTIRQTPENWLWSHRRWKMAPE